MVVFEKKEFVSIAQIFLLLTNAFLFRSDFLGILAAALSFFLLFTPEYLIPSLLISAFMDMDCFIIGNLTASRFYTVLLIIVPVLLSNGKPVLNLKLLAYAFVLVSYISLSAFFSPDGFGSSTVTMILNILLIVSMFSLNTDNFYKVKRLLEIGCIGIMVCIAINFFHGAGIHNNGSFELVEETNNNVVAMSLACIGAFFVGCCVTDQEKEGPLKFIHACLVGASLVLVFFSGSRSALFGLFMAVVAGVVVSFIQSGVKPLKIIELIAVLAAVYIIAISILQAFPVLALRFTLQEIQERGGTGRFDIWYYVWNEIILEHPLFGAGYGGVATLLHESLIRRSGTHNIILNILAQLGLIGFSILIFGLFSCLKKLYAESKVNSYAIIPFIMLLTSFFNGVGENIVSERYFWVVVGIGTMFFNKEINNHKELRKNEKKGIVAKST